MPKTIWVDASNGVAGDMLLGAFLDAGLPQDVLDDVLAALADATGEPLSVSVEPVRRHGLRATAARVQAGTSTTARNLAQIRDILHHAVLIEPVRSFALDVFERLGTAEAEVHGVGLEQVHFHEVGALDALADIVGCAAALHHFGLLEPDAERIVGPVALGSGAVQGAHGLLCVPVPAVVELLAGTRAQVSAGVGDGEACTPTGAALLTTMATGWGGLPSVRITASGSGAGTRDPLDHPNVTRVVIGDRAAGAPTWVEQPLLTLEATVDDLDPRLWPHALDAAHAAGALDAWLTPVFMRHGRPGHVLTALCSAETIDAVRTSIVTTTSTLGVRVYAVDRFALPRTVIRVEVAGHTVPVKIGLLDGQVVLLQPEYADAERAATATGLPLSEVIGRAREQARRQVVEQ